MTTTLHPDIHGSLRYRFRIQRIGVEMEGAWAIKQTQTLDPMTGRVVGPAPYYPRLKEDPSVRNFNHDHLTEKYPYHQICVGEVASDPLIRADLWRWMELNHPTVVNHTCGLHIHMSFRHELDYQQLMTRRYHDHMLLGLHKWGLKHVDPKHCFWPRLRGTNLFCQDVFHADYQVQWKGGHGGFHDNRYGIINFPWQTHKTVEVRVLPMFSDPKLSIMAVRRVLNLTEEFLDKEGSKETSRELIVRVPADVLNLPINAVMEHVDQARMYEGAVEHEILFFDHKKGLISMASNRVYHWLSVMFPRDDHSKWMKAAEPKPVDDEDRMPDTRPRFYPFGINDGRAYGVRDRDLYDAFIHMTPMGGWTAYPTDLVTDRIIEVAQDRYRRWKEARPATPRPTFRTVVPRTTNWGG